MGRTRNRGMGSIFQRGKTWYIAYYADGRQIKEKIGSAPLITKGQADLALKARMGEIVQGRFKLKKPKKAAIFEELVKDYLEYSKANHRSYKRSVTISKVLLRFFGSKRLSEISSFDIERYKVSRKKDDVALSTINRELTVLKRMFNLAIEWEATNSNPVKGVKFFSVVNKPMDIFSEEDFTKLYNSASPHLKPILLCAISTGMRASEIFNLKWEDINIKNESITVRDTKNSDYRVIPLNSDLKQTLLDQFKHNDNSSEYVFLYNGNKIDRVDKSFKTAIRKAGIKNLRFHDLRHTFASRLVMNGVDLVTVQELLGHKSILMTKRYSHPTPEHKKRAVNSIIINSIVSKDLDNRSNRSFLLVNNQ